MCSKKTFFIGMASGLIVGCALTCVCSEEGLFHSQKSMKAKAGKTVKKLVKAIDEIM